MQTAKLTAPNRLRPALAPRLLPRTSAPPALCRPLRVASETSDHVVLPSAPPLRFEEPAAEALERMPHHLSVGQEASTSRPSQRPRKAGSPGSWPKLDMDLGALGALAQPKVLLGAGMLAGLGVDISQPASVVQAVGVLAAIVAVHEAGHFAAARLQGIRVARFAVGFGPAIWKYKGPEVEYCLNAVPLGGYVAFPDDDPTNGSFDPEDPNLLKNRPIPQRALVISAGVIANVLFAYLVLLAQISSVGKAETAFLPGVKVVVPDTPAGAMSAAARGGIRSGDIILRLGDVVVPAAPSQVSTSVSAIRASPGRELVVEVERPSTSAASASGSSSQPGSAEVLQLRVTPDAGSDGGGRMGVQLTSNTYIKHTYAQGPGEVLAMTSSEFNRLAGTVLNGLKQIVTNFGAMSGQLSGPVAIVAAGSEVLRADSAGLFQFAAIVNINLAAVNILPLPALDGGYLFLLAVEAVRGGRKLPAAVEGGIMASGFLLLTALGLGLVVRDTINLL